MLLGSCPLSRWHIFSSTTRKVDICREERIGRFETNKRAEEALNQDDLSVQSGSFQIDLRCWCNAAADVHGLNCKIVIRELLLLFLPCGS